MNRQKGVWITILCILVIGVSVTRLTSDFVTSGTLETIAAADMENSGETTSGTAQDLTEMASSVLEGSSAAGDTGRVGMYRSRTGGTVAAPGAAADSAQAAAGAFDAAEETAEPKEVQEDQEKAPADSGTPKPYAAAPETEAASNTVKSPLEPAPGPGYYQAPSDSAGAASETGYTAEEYRKHLDQTAAQISQYREAPNDSSANFNYIASEYEWDLWDNELNTLYGIIRARMTKEEAETLKQEELEWLKERDMAADKAAAKVNSKNSRSTAYLEASAQKTKERCYELLENYPEVLEREPSSMTESAVKIKESR